MSDSHLISAENAEQQFETFTEYYGIEISDFDDGDDDRISEGIKGKFIRAVRDGLLDVQETENGLVVVQNLRRPLANGTITTLTYGELNGRARKAMRKLKDNYERMYAMLGCMCKESSGIYNEMSARDLTAAENLGSLFLVA